MCFNNIKISNMIIRYFEPLVAKSLIANNERDRGSFFCNDLDLGSGQTERGISKRREKNEVETMDLLVTAHTERDKKSPRILQRNVFINLCDIAGMLFLGNFTHH